MTHGLNTHLKFVGACLRIEPCVGKLLQLFPNYPCSLFEILHNHMTVSQRRLWTESFLNRNGEEIRKSNLDWGTVPAYIIQSYQNKSGAKAELLCQLFLEQNVEDAAGPGPKNGYMYEIKVISKSSDHLILFKLFLSLLRPNFSYCCSLLIEIPEWRTQILTFWRKKPYNFWILPRIPDWNSNDGQQVSRI